MVFGTEEGRVIDEFLVSLKSLEDLTLPFHNKLQPSSQRHILINVKSLADTIEEMGNPLRDFSENLIILV